MRDTNNDNNKVNYLYFEDDHPLRKTVARCSSCNKFISWAKVLKNREKCYHCGFELGLIIN